MTSGRQRKSIKIDEIKDERHKDLEEEEDMLSLNEKLSYERSPLVIFPDSRFKTTWDIVAFVCILYQSIVLPLKMSFNFSFPDWSIYFDLIQDIFFIIDVLLNFNTGFYGKSMLIMTRKAIFLNYL